MKYHELRPNAGARRSRRRIGRGMGSGRGKTAGAGTKGQAARAGGTKAAPFIGGAFPITRTMPYKKGFKSPFRVEYAIVSVGALNDAFEAGAAITVDALKAIGLVRNREARPVKLLSDGETTKSFNIDLHRTSAGARLKIENAGGTVNENLPRREREAREKSVVVASEATSAEE